ncbi:MAG: acyltransferase family protein [Lachnospiraceae bacterium]|jgi:surface polysaccharide O-acyltransferase-like enzyme|nr:acyltransferase family protein [Lachnospiraceae bacterium]
MSRIVKYDILRVVACFSIILLHVSASYWSVVDVRGGEFLVMTVYNSLTRFAVPVFFMLSGLFLVAPERENVAIGKRVLRLVMLFYVWSAFYAFQGIAVDTLKGAFSMEVFRAAVERFIFGHIHMWFLQILCGFYLLIPIARQISAKRETLRYYLLLWIVFRFLVPTLTEAFGLATLQARIDSLGLDMLVGNFGYFLLGYYLNTTNIRKKVRWCIYAMGIGAWILTPFLTVGSCIKSGTYVEKWFSPGSLNILVMTIAVFVFFQYGKAFEQVKRADIWGKLSRYTFFVYMFHMFVLEKLNLVGITTVSYPAVISIPVMTVFIFIVSLFGAFVAGHIPFVRKIVMLASG